MAARLVRTASRLSVIRLMPICWNQSYFASSLLAIKLQRSGFCEGQGTSNGGSPGFIAWSQISSSLHDELNQFAADNDKDGFEHYLKRHDPNYDDDKAADSWIYARHQSQSQQSQGIVFIYPL